MSRDYVDDLLYAWASWVRSGRPALGLSDRSPIYEMVKFGVLSKGIGVKPEPEALQEERTDKAVHSLKTSRPELYEVVIAQYLGEPTGPDTWVKMPDVKRRARYCGISVPTLNSRLASARDWIDGFLGGVA